VPHARKGRAQDVDDFQPLLIQTRENVLAAGKVATTGKHSRPRSARANDAAKRIPLSLSVTTVGIRPGLATQGRSFPASPYAFRLKQLPSQELPL
jgi:hypothetical protein